jgi:hypothetical protein
MSESELKFWWEVWDIVTAVGAIVGVSGLVIQFQLESGAFSERWLNSIRRTSRLLLLAGVVVPAFAQFKTSQITGLYVAILSDRVTTHQLEIQVLHGKNLAVEEKNLALEAAKDDLTRQLAELRKVQDDSQKSTDKRFNETDKKLHPRVIDTNDIALHTRKMRRSVPQVTIVRVKAPEPNLVAEKIGAGLAKSNIEVVPETIESTTLAGMFVCGGVNARTLVARLALSVVKIFETGSLVT